MIKALLSTPSAISLFHRAILHSAPLDYSPQVPALANAVGSAFLFDIAGCTKQKSACLWRLKTPQEFFQAQGTLVYAALAGTFGDSVPFAEPFNIVADGDLVSGDGQTVLSSDKGIIFTTVKDEGCPAVALAQVFLSFAWHLCSLTGLPRLFLFPVLRTQQLPNSRRTKSSTPSLAVERPQFSALDSIRLKELIRRPPKPTLFSSRLISTGTVFLFLSFFRSVVPRSYLRTR